MATSSSTCQGCVQVQGVPPVHLLEGGIRGEGEPCSFRPYPSHKCWVRSVLLAMQTGMQLATPLSNGEFRGSSARRSMRALRVWRRMQQWCEGLCYGAGLECPEHSHSVPPTLSMLLPPVMLRADREMGPINIYEI